MKDMKTYRRSLIPLLSNLQMSGDLGLSIQIQRRKRCVFILMFLRHLRLKTFAQYKLLGLLYRAAGL